MDLNRNGFVIRQFMIVLLTVVLIPFLLFLAWVLMLYIDGYGRVTEKTDISDYCVITGNYDNDRPAEFIHSFFPEEVDDDFSNVSYLYIAQRGDTYACQIWLEFDIENEDAFKDFISSNTVSENVTVFSYDTAYMDYTIANDFELTSPQDDKADDIHIEYAKIGKILYNEDTQHIIFYALCLYDGGYSSTKIFGDFFSRFNIDPMEYEASATDNYFTFHTPAAGNLAA